jgi:hypothetical protein
MSRRFHQLVVEAREALRRLKRADGLARFPRGSASSTRRENTVTRLAGSRSGRLPSRIEWLAVGICFLLPGAPGFAQTQTAQSEIPLHGRTEESMREVARQVHNPIGPLWQLTFDNQVVGLKGGGFDGLEPSYTGSFQPQGPVWLGGAGSGPFAWARDFGIFARLTVPFFETLPVLSGSGGDDRESGFGDLQLGGVFAPKRRSGFLWGIGPTFIFPTASDDALGQGKWQIGPAALAGYIGGRWTAYAIAQQWWSTAGDDDRPNTSQLGLNYVLICMLPRRWQVGMQPTLTVDWTASRGNGVTFPVGLGVGKTVRIGKLPVQLWLETDYYAVRPDDLPGPRWGIDLQITPVLPERF